MAENRKARELENRDATTRTEGWTPPQTLPEPNPVPGWKFKYIRVSYMGANDATNVSTRFREGWEPVKASEVPEIMYMKDNNPNSQFKDNVEIGGLLLCKMPEERVNARRKYYENMNKAQMEGVDNSFMRERDGRSNMEVFSDKKSTTTFGRGR
jgi:hypothetical protein